MNEPISTYDMRSDWPDPENSEAAEDIHALCDELEACRRDLSLRYAQGCWDAMKDEGYEEKRLGPRPGAIGGDSL